MLLAIDIGNTSIKFGVFDGEKLLSKYSISTQRDAIAGDLESSIGGNLDFPVSDAIVCSVVPEIEASVAAFVAGQFSTDAKFVRNDFDFGLKINYEPLSSAGTDRIVNAFAAAEKYGVPCIACSFGTATTVDVVNERHELPGGIIAPGMATMARALHLNTSKLPVVKIEKPPSIIANTTTASIQAGIFYGQIGMVNGILERMTGELAAKPTVVATGGFARMIAGECKAIDIVDENLMLDGLNMLFHRLYGNHKDKNRR